MIDLEAREEGIDAILRSSGPRLRAAMSKSPVVDFRRPRGPHRRRWVIAVATVVMLIVGLVAIGTNRNESVGNDPTMLRWLLREVPAGWRPTFVFDSTTAPSSQVGLGPFAMNIYATDAEPLGPLLTVQGTTDTTEGIEIGSYSGDVLSYEEFELDGKRAAFAALPGGGKGLYVEIDSAWVYLSSRGLSEDVLRALATTLVPDATGRYDVASAALPDGMHKVVSASDPQGDLVSINYSPPGNGLGTLGFSVLPASKSFFGPGSTGYDYKAVSIGDSSGFLGSLTSDYTTPPTTAWLVLWRRDGLEFTLSGQGMSRDQILDAAASASRASPDEWSSVLDTQTVGPDDTAPVATAPPEAPIETAPSFAGEPRDVAITVTVDDVSANEQRWSGVLPSGESWSAKITRVYDRMDIRYSVDGDVVASIFGMSVAAGTGNQVTCCNPMAITKNPDAASLRVLRSNGERYTIPLHELPGTDGVRVALIAIPDGTLLAELIDASGKVLESYAPH